jgi:hypothetical protein
MFQRHTPGPGYSSTYAVVFFCVQYLKWEVVLVKPVLRGHLWDKEKVAF